MNTTTSIRLFVLLAGFSETISAQSTFFDSPPTEVFGGRYLEGLGFIVFGAKSQNGNVDAFGCPKDELFLTDTQGWNPLLSFIDTDGTTTGECPRPILLMRIQDSIDKAGKDAGNATWSFTRDYEAGSDADALNGAIILDLFTPGIGNTPIFKYDAKSYAFHLRTAAQFDYASKNGVAGTDRQEYYFGASFLAPTFEPNGDGLKAAIASKMDVGLRYTDNQITDESSTSFTVQWKPAFRKIFGRDIPITELTEALGKPDPSEQKRNGPGSGISTLETSFRSSDSYRQQFGSPLEPKVFFQPNFELESFLDHVTGKEEGICGCASLDSGISFFDDMLRFTYSARLAHDFDNGDNHIFHTIGGEIRPLPESPMSITAKYIKGERAPSYIDEDSLEIGIGVRF